MDSRPTAPNQGLPSAGKEPPRSCTTLWINLVGLACFFASLAIVPRFGLDPVDGTVVVGFATFLPIILLDVLVNRVHRRSSTGLVWDRAADRSWSRLALKVSGLAGTLGVIALCYWSFPEYRRDFYDPFWVLLDRYGLWATVAALLYFWLLDPRMRAPRDGYWHAGCLMLGFFDHVDWRVLGGHLREWFIKGFFGALMFVYLTRSIADVQGFDLSLSNFSFITFYFFAFELLYAVDLIFAAIGYFLAMRLIDSQIRTSEPTVLGWAAALVCYVPFQHIVFGQYLSYGNEHHWNDGFAAHPVLLAVWGTAILLSLAVYALASVAFGCRFSNLTHRGILTNGPYRLTKHPAYVSKNLSWWLISVPFIPVLGWGDAVRGCLLLLGVNLIYFIRARTEERHLSWDPDYVRYALWINERGIFRWCGRLVPALQFRPPASRAGLAGGGVEGPEPARRGPESALDP